VCVCFFLVVCLHDLLLFFNVLKLKLIKVLCFNSFQVFFLLFSFFFTLLSILNYTYENFLICFNLYALKIEL
jgi:hypothetical protein